MILLNQIFTALRKGYKGYNEVRDLLLLLLNSNISVAVYTFEGQVYQSLNDLPPGFDINLVTVIYVIQEKYAVIIDRKIAYINRHLHNFQISSLNKTDVLLIIPLSCALCLLLLAPWVIISCLGSNC